MLQPRFEQRFDVPAQDGRAHDHRVAARDEHARHLAVLAEIADNPAQVGRGHLEIRLVHELRPAEAVRAVRVAGLALLGEDQDGLRVLVLHPGQRLVVEIWDVERQLPGGMRVQPHPYLMCRGRDFRLGCAAGQERGDPGNVRGGQHVGLREDQAVERVVGGRAPVDEFVDDVGVGPEGQHCPDGPDRQPLGLAQAGPCGQRVQVFRSVGTETSTPIRYWHYLPDAAHGSPSGRSRSRRPCRAASPCGPRLTVFPPPSSAVLGISCGSAAPRPPRHDGGTGITATSARTATPDHASASR